MKYLAALNVYTPIRSSLDECGITATCCRSHRTVAVEVYADLRYNPSRLTPKIYGIIVRKIAVKLQNDRDEAFSLPKRKGEFDLVRQSLREDSPYVAFVECLLNFFAVLESSFMLNQPSP